MQTPSKRDYKKVSPRSIRIQSLLHSEREYEFDAIDEYDWFKSQDFTDRQMIRELLLLHREARKQGYNPAKIRSPQFVTLDMQDKIQQLSEMTNLLVSLVQDIANGSLVPSDSLRKQISTVANRVGVDMSAAILAGKVIEVEIDDVDEGW